MISSDDHTIKILVTESRIESTQSSTGFEQLGPKESVTELIKTSTEKVVDISVASFMTIIDEIAIQFEDKMQNLSTRASFSEATLEFGLVADSEGTVYVFKVGTEANLKVSLKWDSATKNQIEF